MGKGRSGDGLADGRGGIIKGIYKEWREKRRGVEVKLCVSGVCLALLAFASAGVTCYPVRSAAFKPISPRLCHALHIEQKRKKKKKKKEPSDNGAHQHDLEATISSFLSK